MPQDEVIIPEVVVDENPVENISFSPVSNEESEVIVPEVISTEETIVEEKIIPEVVETKEVEEDEVLELNEDLALKYLADSKGVTVDELKDSLTPKEQKQFSPVIEKFQEFIDKTGNDNYNDFLETQKDWSTESQENVLKTYLKLSNPDLDDRQINHLYNKNYNTEDLDEEFDENEILEKGINVKVDLRKANEFLEKRKLEFEAIGGSDAHIPESYREAKKLIDDQIKQEEEFNIDREAKRNSFVSKTEALFNGDFEGFKIKLGDDTIGFEEFSIKPENLKEIKENQLDSNNFISKFLDENTGEIKDIKGYHEAVYMATHYKSELNKAYNRGIAKQLEISDRASKNIQPDNMRSFNSNPTSGITFTKE